MSLHTEALTAAQGRVLRQVGPVVAEQGGYLAGGTALALHLGHRRSVDLDWFTECRIADPLAEAQRIRDAGVPLATGQVERGTLYGTVRGVRISILEYRYPLLAPAVKWPEVGASVASLDDIASMKLAAVAQRGAKKDFVDLFALGSRHRPLPDLLRLYQRKFGIADIAHVLYGLAYFDGADKERMPAMLWTVNWRTVKRTIQDWVRALAAVPPDSSGTQ